MLGARKGSPPSKVTIRDVAREAGVSIGTASRVINGSSNVAPALRQSVERAIMQIGFQPNAAAQSMRNGASRTVGVVVSDIVGERMAILVRAAQEELEKAGYAVFIACHENKQEREREILQGLGRRQVEGLIRSYCVDKSMSLAQASAPPTLPTVLYDRGAPSEADAVCIAHRHGAEQATELLVRLGHRRIGLITGPEFMYPARSRLEGYRAALEAAGLPYDPNLVRANSFLDGFLDASILLGGRDRPSAIILGGIKVLPGALHAIYSQGLEIPRDLSLVAAADSDLARLSRPPITVVRWNFVEVGRTCAQLLLRRLEDRASGYRQILFEPELVVRGSCAPPDSPT